MSHNGIFNIDYEYYGKVMEGQWHTTRNPCGQLMIPQGGILGMESNVLVNRPATPKSRFNHPADNMDILTRNSLFGSQMTNRAMLWRLIKV